MSSRSDTAPALFQRAVGLLDRWIFGAYPLTLEQLALYRIVYALFLLFIAGIPRLDWIARFPDLFFDPPLGLARFFAGFPPPWALAAIGAAQVVLAFALLAGYRTRLVSLALGCAGFIALSLQFSFGKNNHTMLFCFLVPLVLSGSGWGEAYSLDARRRRGPAAAARTWPVTLLSLLLGFAMFTAAYPKWVSGWLDTDTRAIRAFLFNHYYVRMDRELLAGLFVAIDNHVFWELADWLAVGFEFAFLIAVAWPPAFRLMTGLAVLFHLSVLAMLNISFLPHMIVYLVFSMALLPIDHPRFRLVVDRIRPRWIAAACVGYLVLWSFDVPVTFGSLAVSLSSVWFEVTPIRAALVPMLCAAALVVYLLIRQTRSVVQRAR